MAPGEVTFNATGSLTDSVNATYLWDFGDGPSGTGKSAAHVFKDKGNYNVILTLTDVPSVPHTLTKVVTVRQHPINHDYPDGTEHFKVHFWTDDSSKIKYFSWDYGDGSPTEPGISKTSVTHDYPSSSSSCYTVRLTMTLQDDSTIQSEEYFCVGPGTRYIQGHTIYGNETWYSGGTYVVQGGITVAQGATLTIEPGTVVKFNNNVGISVSGTLNADGTSDKPIIFTSVWDNDFGGDTDLNYGDGYPTLPGAHAYTDSGGYANSAFNLWGSIYFGATSTNSVIDHAILRYSGYNGWTFYISSSSVTVSQSEISHSFSRGVHISNASPTVTGNTITANGGCGIELSASNATITGNTINNNINYGIYAHNTSNPTITDNTISGNSGYGLNYYGSAVVNATNNNWGDSSGPLDDSDDRATGGLYNPNGKGNRVSDHVTYYPWIGFTPADINNDGVLDLMDAILALQINSDISISTQVYKEADVNGDGKIGMGEVIYILQKAAGVR
jgi:parallel beta-helix repeat protein